MFLITEMVNRKLMETAWQAVVSYKEMLHHLAAKRGESFNLAQCEPAPQKFEKSLPNNARLFLRT